MEKGNFWFSRKLGWFTVRVFQRILLFINNVGFISLQECWIQTRIEHNVLCKILSKYVLLHLMFFHISLRKFGGWSYNILYLEDGFSDRFGSAQLKVFIGYIKKHTKTFFYNFLSLNIDFPNCDFLVCDFFLSVLKFEPKCKTCLRGC